MAVTLDSTGNPNFVTAGTAITSLITVSASATAMLSWLSFSADPGAMTVSWNSSTQFLTLLTTIASTGTTTANAWGLLNPAAGSSILVRALWVNSVNASMNTVTFFNTNTASLAGCFANVTTKTSVGQLPNITVTSQTSDMVVGIYGSSATIDSVDNTQIYISNSGSMHSAANEAAGAASLTLGSSIGTSATWVSIGVDVVAASGATVPSFMAGSWSALPVRYSVIGA